MLHRTTQRNTPRQTFTTFLLTSIKSLSLVLVSGDRRPRFLFAEPHAQPVPHLAGQLSAGSVDVVAARALSW